MKALINNFIRRLNVLFPLLLLTFLFSCGEGVPVLSSDQNAQLRENEDPDDPEGKGGSLAQFTIKGDYLYSILHNELSTYRIDSDQKITFLERQQMPFNAETIFPFHDYLLIGAQTGVFIYYTKDNGIPKYGSKFEHIRACDPVVAQEWYAYFTLRSTGQCGGNNSLSVLDISDIGNPKLEFTTRLKNPHGLAVDGDLLFVCQGELGVSVFDIKERTQPKLHKQLADTKAKDVILDPQKKVAMFLGYGELIQWDYADIDELQEISNYEL